MTCEKCNFYSMVDSGYGKCVRFPPVFVKYSENFGTKHITDFIYPQIAFNNISCGEFKNRGKNGIKMQR